MPLKRTVPILVLLTVLLAVACAPPSIPSPTPAPQATVLPSTPLPPPSPTPERPLAARVNGEPIYLVDYERQVALYETAMLASDEDFSSPEAQARRRQMREQILNWMIEQELIEQAAARMGIVITDEQVDAELAQAIENSGGEAVFQQWLEQNGLTREEAWQELRAELLGAAVSEQITASVPETGEQVHARHIQVDTRAEAERLLAQLQAGEDFGALARAYSQDEHTREQGGDLGFFPQGVLTAREVEEAAFNLQPGQISGIVESALGYHIVQVLEREPNVPLGEESLRYLREQALAEWKESLWAEANIERFVEQGP